MARAHYLKHLLDSVSTFEMVTRRPLILQTVHDPTALDPLLQVPVPSKLNVMRAEYANCPILTVIDAPGLILKVRHCRKMGIDLSYQLSEIAEGQENVPPKKNANDDLTSGVSRKCQYRIKGDSKMLIIQVLRIKAHHTLRFVCYLHIIIILHCIRDFLPHGKASDSR
ncbi:hypothetical protein R6Q57_025890 [Mikania cordata]